MSTAKKAVKRPAKKAAKKAVSNDVTASIKVMGRVYDVAAPSVMQALEKLQVPNGSGRAVLTVTRGKRTVTRIIQPLFVRRLFSPSPTMRNMALKNLYFLVNI
jgi:hypothetical protein